MLHFVCRFAQYHCAKFRHNFSDLLGERFFIQPADRGGKFLVDPQGHGVILHPLYKDASQIHLNEGFFHAASDEFFDLFVDVFFVGLYNLLGHSLLAPF